MCIRDRYVDDIVTVTEDETAAAILSLMENQKLVAEGAGAVPVAAVLFHNCLLYTSRCSWIPAGRSVR